MQKILLINPPVRSDEAVARGSEATASLIPPLVNEHKMKLDLLIGGRP